MVSGYYIFQFIHIVYNILLQLFVRLKCLYKFSFSNIVIRLC